MLILCCILYAVALVAEVVLIHLCAKNIFGIDIPKIANGVINDMLDEFCVNFENSEHNQRDKK